MTARAHHYVPQCWLAGFTESCERDGRLWVTDLARQKQWPSSPEHAGHRRDYNRVDMPAVDPLIVENSVYGAYESAAGPILQSLRTERREPTRGELQDLLTFAALQWTRVPKFREMARGVVEDIGKGDFETRLSTRDAWEQWCREVGIPDDATEANYEMAESMREALGHAKLEAPREWFIRQALLAMDVVEEALQARTWQTKLSVSGCLIASDNPVIIDGPNQEKVGFINAPIVGYPVNKYVALWSEPSNAGMMRRATTRTQIASINTFVMLSADEQLYSDQPDFCWLDENQNFQTDWRAFNRDRFLEKYSSHEKRLESE